MSIDQAWATTTADSTFEDDVIPPAGWMGIVQVASTRAGVSKKGETYLAVDIKDESGQYHWAIYKQLTTNGVAQDGKVKSAKITLRQLGIDQNIAWPLVDAALKAKVGSWYAVEQKASTTINNTTGVPFVNTEIVGVASAPAQVVNPTTEPPAGQQFTTSSPEFTQPPPQPTYVQRARAAGRGQIRPKTGQPPAATFPPAVRRHARDGRAAAGPAGGARAAAGPAHRHTCSRTSVTDSTATPPRRGAALQLLLVAHTSRLSSGSCREPFEGLATHIVNSAPSEAETTTALRKLA